MASHRDRQAKGVRCRERWWYGAERAEKRGVGKAPVEQQSDEGEVPRFASRKWKKWSFSAEAQ